MSDNRFRKFVCVTAVAVLLVGQNPVLAATLVHPPAKITAVGLNPCRQHANHRCRVELGPHPAILLPAGGSTFFQGVMAQDYPTWTLANGGALAGTFTITTYDAFNDCNPGGAEFRMSFAPGAGDPAIVWSQAIFTNQRLNGVEGTYTRYMDVKTTGPELPPAYPFQYADQHFYDKSSRDCPGGGYIRWDGEFFATVLDRATKTMTIYDGVEWGWRYWCWSLEPVRASDASDGVPDPTWGCTNALLTYDPFLSTLTVSGSVVDILNLTGGNEVSPGFITDPLRGAVARIDHLQWAGRGNDGGYLFTDGLLTVQRGTRILLTAEVDGLIVDDQILPHQGGNLNGIMGRIDAVNQLNSPAVNMYRNSLNAGSIPLLTIQTQGPFSQMLADGEFPVTGQGTLKVGFASAHDPLFEKGDANCDGVVNNFDIDAFVRAIADPESYATDYPECDAALVCDINEDGVVNNFDIDPFIMLLVN